MTSIPDSLTEGYDTWYDSKEGRPLYESQFACLKPLVEEAPRPILEIGVGTGRFTMYFLPATGIDPTLTRSSGDPTSRWKPKSLLMVMWRGPDLSAL